MLERIFYTKKAAPCQPRLLAKTMLLLLREKAMKKSF